MTPFEQLVESLEVERLRPVPPPPDLTPFRPVVNVLSPFEVARLVREVEPADVDACERARQRRLRSHAKVRWTVLTDAEIEAI